MLATSQYEHGRRAHMLPTRQPQQKYGLHPVTVLNDGTRELGQRVQPQIPH